MPPGTGRRSCSVVRHTESDCTPPVWPIANQPSTLIAMEQPDRIRVVVLHYGDPDRTRRALASLARQNTTGAVLDVVVVDNDPTSRLGPIDSIDGMAFRQIKSDFNRGFGGGCNLALTDLDTTDYVALLNNDAVAEPEWLHNLYTALRDDPRAGAATSKLLLDSQYGKVRISLDHAGMTGLADKRYLRLAKRIRVNDISTPDGSPVDGAFVKHRTDYIDVLVPIGRAPITLQLTTTKAQRKLGPLALSLSWDNHTQNITAGSTNTVTVDQIEERFDVIANAGNDLTDTANATDRGWLEIDHDDPYFDQQSQVFAWCGGAVLLRASCLKQTGIFDESLFLYYEDLELAWRANELGWHTIYVPSAIVRHEHAASSVEGSEFKALNTLRNRLVVLARHDRPARVSRLVVRHVASIGVTAARDVAAMRNGSPRASTPSGVRTRAFVGFTRRLPSALRARRADRSTQRELWG